MNSLKVLVVDDERMICELSRALLTHLGYKEILLADRGEKAVEIAKKEEIDVILMDVMMPGIGGIEASLRIQELQPNLPILFITGYDDIQIEGVTHCLVLRKPISLDMLEDGLKLLLGTL